MILPGAIIGGAPRLPSEITSIFFGYQTATNFTVSSLDWGDVVKGQNKRSVVVTLSMFSSENITGTPTINGASASIIFNDTTPSVGGLSYRIVCFAADVPTGATGDVTFSTTSAAEVLIGVSRTINLDVSTETDSDINAATNLATLAIDCPAGGGVIGHGTYAYSGGSTPTSADFANLSTLEFIDSNIGGTLSGATFATVQTGLSVTFDPTPNTNLSRSHAAALAFARTY